MVKITPLVVAVALVAGCAESNAVPNAISQITPSTTSHAKKNRPMLYVSDAGNDTVSFFTYPALKLAGTLTGFGAVNGLCANKADVFVVDAQKDQIVGYARGASAPSKVLYDQGYHPNGCAVDPLTGKLAATLRSEGSKPGVLALFSHASGRPVYYGTGNIAEPAFCGYDNKGNLFVDGIDKDGNFAFGEMPFAYNSVFPVTLDQTIAVPGGVQWDGTYVTVGDEGTGAVNSTIYQFSIDSFSGTLEGTVRLEASTQVAQYWIGKTRVIGPNSGSTHVKFWAYPAGGPALRSLGGFSKPIATVLSGA